ncbi:RICIN domain-containing protein [Kitasatospora sp. NPDC050543]|uniref:RICIN domain-containing protein n=1 Tax=Kitasatospora sp. NPDC050543 TaxID=3364054 RepID=UPI0037A1225C
MARRRADRKRRNNRKLAITAVAVTAALAASVFGIQSVTGAQRPGTVSADALGSGNQAGGVPDLDASALGEAVSGVATKAPTPAAKPQHNQAATPIKEIPKSEPDKGLVYAGLQAAPKDDPCEGVYKVSQAALCTHGPDEPPSGVDIHKDTAPAVAATDKAPVLQGDGKAPAPSASDLLKDLPPVLDAQSGATVGDSTPKPAAAAAAAAAPAAGPAGGSTSPAADASVQCDGDGTTGNRVQVLYVHAPGQDRFAQYLPSFKKWAADTDAIYNASAGETGGVRHVRYVTGPDCTVSVLNVEVSAGALREFGAANDALASQGFNRRDRKYMIFADAQVYCGIGTFAGDERPSQDNRSNFGPSYGRTDSGCWGGSTAAHELGHNLGAVNNSAPHTSRAGHCVDEWDIMCYSDTPYYPKMQTLCPDRGHDERLDCNHDDYYNTSPQPGSYLTTHWNVANNQFLIAGNGTNPNPNPTPTPTPTKTTTPSPTPTKPNPTGSPTPTTTPTPTSTPTQPTPTPTSTPTGTPSTGPDVTASQITQNSAVLSWPKVDGVAGYEIQLNGKALATVTSTVVRVVQMQPNTQYSFAIAVKDQQGKVSKPGRAAAFRTLAAGGGTGPTQPGKRYLMLNSLTGHSADMWGSSTNDGAVLIAYQRTGYANQQWLFDDAGDGYLRIKSAVSGKCLQIGGQAVAGQYVMQQPCNTGAATQQWKLTASGSGYTLTAKGSDVVLGESSRWYYGGRLLELQKPDSQGYQNWTVQPTS